MHSLIKLVFISMMVIQLLIRVLDIEIYLMIKKLYLELMHFMTEKLKLHIKGWV